METEEIKNKLSTYMDAYSLALKKLGDTEAALGVVQELGKDLRTEAIRSEWQRGIAVRKADRASGANGDAGDGVEATPKQLAFLKRLGVKETPASKQEASEMIDNAVLLQ